MIRPDRRGVRALAGALALVALGVAGCTSSGTGPSPASGSSTPAAATSTTPDAVPTSAATPTTASARPSTTIVTSASSTPKTSRASSSQPPPSSTPATRTTSRPGPTTTATLTAPPAQGGTCTAAQLKLQTMRGGASQGREYGAVSFTNISSSTCTMRGYPAAQLLRGGALLGNPAGRDLTGTVRTLKLKPGATVQSVISAVSTCQSPLSDHVRVIVPGSRTPSDVGIELRACSLTIGPVDLP